MKFIAFAASHRSVSLNYKLISTASEAARACGAEVSVLPYAQLDMPLYNDEEAQQTLPKTASLLADAIAQCDGLMIASPEYNWSIPGSLKNIIDWTSKLPNAPLAGKTALLMSATPGSRGGIMGLQHLKIPLEALQMFVFPRLLPVGNADKLFAAGTLEDKKQLTLLNQLVEDYISFTQKLRR